MTQVAYSLQLVDEEFSDLSPVFEAFSAPCVLRLSVNLAVGALLEPLFGGFQKMNARRFGLRSAGKIHHITEVP